MVLFKSSNLAFAAIALLIPKVEEPNNICLCKLDSDTASKSIIPIVPIPAAVRYCSTGQPNPPAPITKTLDLESLSWPS